MSSSGIRTKKLCALSLSVIIFTCLSETAQAGCLKGAVVSGGEDHTLVLMADKYNTVWACGKGGPHLGIGEGGDQTTLTQVLGGEMDSDIFKNIADIAAGWTHSLALDNNGFVWAWGQDSLGELGNGSGSESKYTPVRVLSGEQNDTPGTYLQDIAGIAAGRSGNHSLAVSSDGYCWAWGADSHGQVGDGSDDDPHNVPSQVHGVGDTGVLENIVAVSGGELFSIALEDLNEVGRVFTFGEDTNGQLGNGAANNDNQYAPVIVLKGQQPSSSAYLENIAAISAGWDHAMALDGDGFVYCWGEGREGQLGDGSDPPQIRYEPVRVLKGEQDPCDPCSVYLHDIVAISAGDVHCMALEDLSKGGHVWTWGSNSSAHLEILEAGQLGNGTWDPSPTPVKVVGGQMGTEYLENIVAISAGYWHCLAIDTDGVIWSWGVGRNGRLGIGDDTNNKNVPQRVGCVPDFSLTKVDDVSDCISPRDGAITYTINYDYQSNEEWEPAPEDFESILIYDHFAKGTEFVWATRTPTVSDANAIWSIDPESWDGPSSVQLVMQVNRKIEPGGKVENFAEIIATLDQKQYIYHEIIETPVCDCDGLGEIIYVDGDVLDPCDGSTWTKAFKTLTDALSVAWPCDEIWVAKSENAYKPTTDPCDVKATFRLVSGVGVYGGFIGGQEGEEHRYERNWFDNETIISGDIHGSVNVEYVVTSNANAPVSVIDGFTINDGGVAGIYCKNSSPIIQHNKITDNDTGIYFFESEEPVSKNNWIYKNATGIYFDKPEDTAVVRNNTIAYNTDYGMSASEIDPNISISNCILWGNGTQLNLDFVPAYSCIQNWTQGGTENISSDPCFVSEVSDNYLLKAESLCIDAGDPCANYTGERDIDKHFRVLNGDGDNYNMRVDVGADEFCNQGTDNDADFNEDGIVNNIDFAIFSKAWLSDDPCDDNWNVDCDLAADGIIDASDLVILAEEWLWMSCEGMKDIPMMEMMMGMGGGMDKMAGAESMLISEPAAEQISKTQPQPEPSVAERIEQIKQSLDWLYEVKDTMDEKTWLSLTTSLEEMLKELEDSQ